MNVLLLCCTIRKLDDVWSREAKELEEELDCKIMGRSRKQKVILSDEFVIEKLDIDAKTIDLQAV